MVILSKNLAEIARYMKPGVAQPDPHSNLDLHARQSNRVWVAVWSGVDDSRLIFQVIVA
jgi:hypothetical protein